MTTPSPAHEAIPGESRRDATLIDYLSIARPSHWVKHVFILPGIVLAYLLKPTDPIGLIVPILVGFVSAALTASANYVLNEWLDADYDVHHPRKSKRSAVTKNMPARWVWLEYVLLAATGLALGAAVSRLFAWAIVGLLISGVAYNVWPLRTKDRVFLDVLSEALNNPIRLTLGWAMVDPSTLPPSSLFLAYWMGGAFLMGMKRFAEYRTVTATSGVDTLASYRRSFRHYTQDRLMVSSFLYAQMAAFFLAVFLIKYRVEYLLSLPFFALLFASYLRVGLKHESRVQEPEQLFREKSLVAVVLVLIGVLTLLTIVDLPILERLSDPHFIELPVD